MTPRLMWLRARQKYFGDYAFEVLDRVMPLAA